MRDIVTRTELCLHAINEQIECAVQTRYIGDLEFQRIGIGQAGVGIFEISRADLIPVIGVVVVVVQLDLAVADDRILAFAQVNAVAVLDGGGIVDRCGRDVEGDIRGCQ